MELTRPQSHPRSPPRVDPYQLPAAHKPVLATAIQDDEVDQAIPKLSDEGASLHPNFHRGNAVADRIETKALQVSPVPSGMSVLHVVEALLGGPASYLREILPAQAARFGRHRVGLIIPRDQKEHLQGHESFRTGYFSSRRPRILNVLRLILKVRGWLRRHSVDVIHAQGTFAGVAVRLAVWGMASPPKIIYCAHGWAFDRKTSAWKNWVVATVERLLAPWADSIVCISSHDYRSALRVGIDETRLFEIVNGIGDLPRDLEKQSVFWPPSKRRFLFVGRFDHQKGLEVFLQAMNALGSDVVGYAIGQPVIKNPPRLEFPENVKQTGWLPRELVQAYMQSADVVVMPSRWEGFGLTAVEAMRAGKTVIATDVGGLSEIVEHGVTGLLVKPNDLLELISAMNSLTPDDLQRMGRAGRARYLERFHAERMNNSLCNLYELTMLQ